MTPEKSTFTNTITFSVFLGEEKKSYYSHFRLEVSLPRTCSAPCKFLTTTFRFSNVRLTCKNSVVVGVQRQRHDAFTVRPAEVALVQVESEGFLQEIHGAAVVARVDQSNSFQEERLLRGTGGVEMIQQATLCIAFFKFKINQPTV